MAGIKGTTKELYVRKESIDILTLTGNVSMSYQNIKRIDYCLAETFRFGYVNFITTDNKKQAFEFGKKSNEDVQRVIKAIKKAYPEIPFKEYQQGENAKDRSILITATFGYKEIGCKLPNIIIKQKPNGDVYFNNNTSVFYDLVGYEWRGPDFDIVINSESSEDFTQNKHSKKNGKALKIGAGAVLGSLVAPGVGTVIGAAMGAGSKTKIKERTTGKALANSSSITSNVEKFTNALIIFRSQDNGKEYKLSFKCNQDIDVQIRCFDFIQED